MTICLKTGVNRNDCTSCALVYSAVAELSAMEGLAKFDKMIFVFIANDSFLPSRTNS